MPRPCKRRRVCALPERLRFGPAGQSAGEPIRMGVDEFETIRLIDLEGLTQEACAGQMQVSRATVQAIYGAARRKLAQHGISCEGKRARQLRREDYEDWDLLIGMDQANIRNMRRICGGDPEGKIHLMLDYAGRSGQEVADPWYTGDFEATWQDVLSGCQGLLAAVTEG